MSTPFGKPLSTRQRRAIAALLTAKNVKAAAEAARVGESTLRRWMADNTEFCVALNAASQQALDQVALRLAGGAAEALSTLETLIEGGKEPIKLRAALGWLSTLIRLREQASLEKLDILEQILHELYKDREGTDND